MSTVKQKNTVADASSGFRLRGGLYPLTLLEISAYDRDSFEAFLQQKTAEAPAFFRHTPILLSLEGRADLAVPLADVVALARSYHMIPIALRGGSQAQQEDALAAGLALMPESRNRDTSGARDLGSADAAAREVVAQSLEKAAEAVAQEAAEAAAPLPITNGGNPNKVVSIPIRSGQQVYAAGGDLIVLSSVSPGAEVLADGNIHIYGALRGRALAGVRGDKNARIFCHSLEAELISIAGDFKVAEDLRGEHWKRSVQIELDDTKLSIQDLTK